MSATGATLPPVPYQSAVSGKGAILTQVWAAWFRQLSAVVASLSGGSSSSGTAYQEMPGGTVNGSNTQFTLSYTPVSAFDLDYYWDGVYQYQGVDYTISSQTITMAVAPTAGQPWAKYHH